MKRVVIALLLFTIISVVGGQVVPRETFSTTYWGFSFSYWSSHNTVVSIETSEAASQVSGTSDDFGSSYFYSTEENFASSFADNFSILLFFYLFSLLYF